jgi:protein-disulfide isomerase
MAWKPVEELLNVLTTRKAAALAGVGAIAVAGLIAIGSNGGKPGVTRALAEESVAKPPVAAGAPAPFTAEQTQAIQQIVKEYLLKNPEVLVEVSKELEQRQQSAQADEHRKVILDQKSKIFSSALDYVGGNPKGDITIVEFFDYNCAWCKRALDEIVKVTKSDPKVRLVLKEFPIFGADSTLAAKAAIASVRQGKYWDFHLAMMREKQVTKDNLFQIAAKVGLDVNRLKADMDDPKVEAQHKETSQIAQSLNIEGTPGFIVDDKLNVGYLPADGMQALIGDSRKEGCKVC